MSILGYLLIAVAKVLGIVINIYTVVVVAAALITWINPDPYNPLVRILRDLTEPVFRIVRRILPRALRELRIDITPMIILLALVIIETVIGGLLFDLGRGMIR